MKIFRCVFCLLLTMKFTTFCEAQNIRTVALTGQTLSSAAGDVTLDFVGLPTLNNSGHAAFMGRITGPGINNTNDSAILTEGIGGNMVVLPQKEAIFPAGDDHVPVKRFGIPVLSDSGHTVFQAEVNRPISFPLLIFGGGYWRVDEFGAMSSTVIGDRISIAGRGGEFRISVPQSLFPSRPLVGRNGEIAFSASVVDSSTSDEITRGIWLNDEEHEGRFVVEVGEVAPGTEPNTIFGTVRAVSLSGNGQVMFHSDMVGDEVNESNDESLWREDSLGGLALIAREGSQAEGTASNVVFNQFFEYDNNSLGQAAFLSTLIGPGVDDSNRVGIWKTNQSGESELVARDGDEAINLEGYEYNRLRNLVLNESGDIAFSDRIGIWSDVDGNGPKLVVEKGFQAVAPGTDNSAYFKQGISPGIMLNSLGQLAFLAVLDGFNVDTSNNLGIWAQDTSGELQLVVRSGDKIDVDNSESVDLRTISSLSTGHMHETKPLVFNDHGQITFRAEFTDGSSGIFVSNLVAVPEPSSLFLVAIAMMGVLGTRSRRI